MVAAMATVRTARRIMATVMCVGITATTISMDVSSAAIVAVGKGIE